MKTQDIKETDWDILIILDACRYDYFKEIHKNYLKGKLSQRRSKGSNTGEWLKNTFTKKYDLTYISANPYVNNYGLKLPECNPKFDYDWKATDHFSDIINVWNNSWDEELGTVHPREVNITYFRNKPKKAILHYLQPHLPYLKKDSTGSWENTIFRVKSKAGREKGITKKFKKIIRPIIRQKIGKKNFWELRKLLGLQPRTPFEEAWRKKDNREIKKHYKQNLEIVLESVSNLIKEIDKKVVITSDHGEGLGEKGIWGHPPETHKDILTTVPWFIVE